MKLSKSHLSPAIGVLTAVIYGVLVRIILGRDSQLFGSLSLSFFVFAPPALGYLTVHLATEAQRQSFLYVFFAPWLTCGLCMLIAGLFVLEAWFCILLAIPAFLVLSSIGGLLAVVVRTLARYFHSRRTGLGATAVIVLLPFMFVPLEHALPVQEQVRTVHSRVAIDAPPEVVWKNITNLRRVSPEETGLPLFYMLGLPRPLEARMVCERVGCIRTGQWENGLEFVGTITSIQRNRSYWLTLQAETAHVLPSRAPLGDIGGRAFGMVDDGYEIVDLGGGRSELHLYSSYRISTRMNTYAQVWLDFLMRDIQGYILGIEKVRCEGQSD